MANVGVEKNFVDTQGISLSNLSDAKTYTQLTDVNFEIDSSVTKHQRTDDKIDNVFSLPMIFIEANITLTTPELPDLVTLTKNVNGKKPTKTWSLSMNDGDNQTKLLSFAAQTKKIQVYVFDHYVRLFHEVQYYLRT